MSELFPNPNGKPKFYELQPGECVCVLGAMAMRFDDDAKRTLARDSFLWDSSAVGIRLKCAEHGMKLYPHVIQTINAENLR